MKRLAITLSFVLLAAACNRATPGGSHVDDPSAHAVLEQVTAAYAALSSYRDNGTVTIYLDGGGQKELTFSTAFLRPSRIRFKLAKPGATTPSYDVWTDDKSAQVASPPHPVSVRATPFAALGKVAGVSGGASVLVPKLLLDDVSGWRLADLRQAVRMEEETSLHYEIAAVTPSGAKVELRIARADMMIVRFQQRNTAGKLLRRIEYRSQPGATVDPSEMVETAHRASPTQPERAPSSP